MYGEEDEVGTGGSGKIAKPSKEPGTTDAELSDALLRGETWSEFCEALRRAGTEMLHPDVSAQERAEGFRYLLGLVSSGVRQATVLADPDFPCFLRNPDSHAKWGAENADNQYLWARIRPDAEYRITGQRGSAHAFLIEIKEGYMQQGQVRNFACLHSDEIEAGPNGCFEIVLSARPHPSPWIPLHPDAAYVLIRQYFHDWEGEQPARFRIERLGGEGEAPRVLDPSGAARMLKSASEWIETSARVWNEWVERLRSEYRPGQIAAARHYLGGAEDIRYGNDAWRLEPGQALLLECEPPQARYWSFQLCDLWFQSLDFTNHQTSLNGRQAWIDHDGRFRCVIAAEDPGIPNWLDSVGHLEGIVQYRWVWSRNHPHPTARVIAWAEISRVLPSDTPRISPEKRRAMIHMRQNHVRRREPSY